VLLLVTFGGKKVPLECGVHRSESRSEERRLRRVQDGRLGSKAFLQIFALWRSAARSKILLHRDRKTHLVLLQKDIGHRGKVG
jgi:hypothetical protein